MEDEESESYIELLRDGLSFCFFFDFVFDFHDSRSGFGQVHVLRTDSITNTTTRSLSSSVTCLIVVTSRIRRCRFVGSTFSFGRLLFFSSLFVAYLGKFWKV